MEKKKINWLWKYKIFQSDSNERKSKENIFLVWFLDNEIVEIIIYNLNCVTDMEMLKEQPFSSMLKKSVALRPVVKRHIQKSSLGDLGTLEATLYRIPFLTRKCRREWVVHMNTEGSAKETCLFIEKLTWGNCVGIKYSDRIVCSSCISSGVATCGKKIR